MTATLERDPYADADASDPRATAVRHRRLPPAEFGPALAAARARAGWSLADLAGRCGLSRGFLCRLERGLRAPSVVTVARLVEVLPMSEVERSVVVGAGLPGVGRDWRPKETHEKVLLGETHEPAQACVPVRDSAIIAGESRYSVTDHRSERERAMMNTIGAFWAGRT